MNLYHLRYFVVLAHEEHYTKASEKLCITQPNLTHAIKSLEAELGVPLFQKEGRNVVLTKYGKQFLADVEDSLSILDHGIEKMQNIGSGKECIEIGFLRRLGTQYIPDKIAQFCKLENNVSFHYHDGLSYELLDMLLNRTCDVVFCSKVPQYERIEFVPILSNDMYLIVSYDHPLAEYNEIELSETLDYPYIFFHENSGVRPLIDDLFKEMDKKPNVIMELEEDEVIAGFVAKNLGIAVIPDMDYLNLLPIKKIKIKDEHIKQTFYMAYLKDDKHTKAINDFISFIKD